MACSSSDLLLEKWQPSELMRSLIAVSPSTCMVTTIISVYLVSVAEEYLSYGQALQEVSAQGDDWLGNYYTNNIYKGKK